MFTTAKIAWKRSRNLKRKNKLAMIKAIIFDFDETLYVGKILSKWPEFVKTGFLKILKSEERVKQLDEKYHFNKETSQFVSMEICRNENINPKKMIKFFKTNYCECDRKDVPSISNGFLKALAKHYPLYILSLSEKIHINHYAKLFGIDLKPFKKILTLSPLDESKEVEIRKVMKKEKLLPGEVLMVGDSMENDILPAQKAGVKTLHFKTDFNEIYDYFTENNILNCEEFK